MIERNDRETQLRASLERMLARISPANRPFVADRLREREIRGCRISSQTQWLNVVVQVDEALAGAPFDQVQPRELAEVIAAWRRKKQDTTLALHTMYVRGLWAIVLGVRTPKDLPAAFVRALDVPEPVRRVKGRVLTEGEFERVVQAILTHDEGSQRAFRSPMKVAALWTLRDVGHRAREMLSLNVGDVVFKTTKAADGSTVQNVRLHLRKDAPNLKTGARTAIGQRCAAPLKAWLALHPRGTDPKAPLFCGIRDDTGMHRWDYKELRKVIVRAGREAGVSETPENPGKLRPHDFRHTAATEKARTGWGELLMKEQFGWAGGSDMPAHYAHLTFEDVEAQVLKDAGIDNVGRALATAKATPAAGVAGLDDAAVLAALRRLLTNG
ncbi:MAG TPA: site-specific integrase [Candidatus Thermoplasmatota archaeon]|nr:site-specific integrase [Candidatus Thermoplasmatota archaeon]